MAVLVTGAFGFVGFNIVEEVLRQRREVVLFDIGQLPDSLERALAHWPNAWKVVRGDVRDSSALDQVMRDHPITQVVHAAAITADTEREIRDPQSVLDVNVLGSVNVLRAAHRNGIERFLYLGSAAVYGDSAFDHDFLDEVDTIPLPADLYPISKYAAERTMLRLGGLLAMNLATVRLTEVYGPWEYDTGFTDTLSPILQIIRLAFAGREVVLPRASWKDRCYSRDIAQGVVAVLMADKANAGPYNICPGASWPLTEWCERLAVHLPGFRWRIAADPKQANVDCFGERDRKSLSPHRLATDIGYRSTFSIDAAFTDYMAWLDDHAAFGT